MASFGSNSRKNLEGIDERLVRLFERVVKTHDCSIVYGLRTLEEQKQLVADGKSKTMHSKHLEGKAVDVAPYPIDWKDVKRFYYFAGIVIGIAEEMGINIRWGGDCNGNDNLGDQTFFDLDHFELRD